MISRHDLHCLNGIDNDYTTRYQTDWIKEGEELKNPYLSYLRKHVPGRNVPYSNDPFYTGHDINENNSYSSTHNYHNDNYNYLTDESSFEFNNNNNNNIVNNNNNSYNSNNN